MHNEKKTTNKHIVRYQRSILFVRAAEAVIWSVLWCMKGS